MYQPRPADARTLEDLVRMVQEEFRAIAGAINEPNFSQVTYEVLSNAPSKPRKGNVYLADATNWDPLSTGAGNAYFVWYTGSAYRGLHETANGTNLG